MRRRAMPKKRTGFQRETWNKRTRESTTQVCMQLQYWTKLTMLCSRFFSVGQRWLFVIYCAPSLPTYQSAGLSWFCWVERICFVYVWRKVFRMR